MRKFIIERNITGIGNASPDDLGNAARKSNATLRELGPGIQWQQSYVTKDKTYCVYLAEDEDVIRRHAQMSGFPVDSIVEVTEIIDPATGRD